MDLPDKEAILDKEGAIGTLWYKYRRIIIRIGDYSVLDELTIDKIRDEKYKHLIQSGYRDKKAIGFHGNLIEFFLWISMAHIVCQLRAQIPEPEQASLLGWAVAIIESYDDSALRVDIKNLLNFFTRHKFFYSAFKAEIEAHPYPSTLDIEGEWGATEELKEIMKCDCVFASFIELVLYHDELKRKREDHAELVDFIKEIVK